MRALFPSMGTRVHDGGDDTAMSIVDCIYLL